MENEVRQCDGRCEKCNIYQRTYCSAQMAYYNQQEIAEIKRMLVSQSDSTVQTIISKDVVVDINEEQTIDNRVKNIQ